jgi:hypothetical protein
MIERTQTKGPLKCMLERPRVAALVDYWLFGLSELIFFGSGFEPLEAMRSSLLSAHRKR